MTRTNSLPRTATVLRRYADLDRYARAFANGDLNLLFVAGRPGQGKSRRMRQVVGDKARWLEGNASAFRTYIDLFRHKDEAIVLDDVAGLDADPQWASLLKTVCQTDEEKTVGWHTQAPALEREGVPRSFTTRSRLCVICNQLKARDRDVEAVLDRGQVVVFEPSPAEVHALTAEWFRDQEVFDFVAAHLHMAPHLSMRDYYRAAELKRFEPDWRGVLLDRWGVAEKTRAVATLKADSSFACEEDRVRAFVAGGHGSRASYFSHAKKLAPARGVTVPAITLAGAEPPPAAAPTPAKAPRKRESRVRKG